MNRRKGLNFEGVEGFEWDPGNVKKNVEKHGVFPSECEQVFFEAPLLVLDDESHSSDEKRYLALGKTNRGRHLFVVFTIRRARLRVISARGMNRKEKRLYEEKAKENSYV